MFGARTLGRKAQGGGIIQRGHRKLQFQTDPHDSAVAGGRRRRDRRREQPAVRRLPVAGGLARRPRGARPVGGGFHGHLRPWPSSSATGGRGRLARWPGRATATPKPCGSPAWPTGRPRSTTCRAPWLPHRPARRRDSRHRGIRPRRPGRWLERPAGYQRYQRLREPPSPDPDEKPDQPDDQHDQGDPPQDAGRRSRARPG